jgi:hypothetical protein
MYYGNLTVFSALDEARERVCEYHRVNCMRDLKKGSMTDFNLLAPEFDI